MEISVVVEPVENVGYRATGLGLSAEGASSEAALQRLQEQIEERIARGVRIVSLQVPKDKNPWLRFAGGLKDHALADRWEQAMADYRMEVDSQPDEL
ncbi:MAG TPA: hypothetical protein VFJ58_15105 [Armatimonadota bacterium]|nr:hypothetical protein [Armatimonadota bacterium]